MPNVNSFSQNVENLIKSVNNSLLLVYGLSQSMTATSPTINIQSNDPSMLITYPSYQYMINSLANVNTTLNAFLNGSGIALDQSNGLNQTIKTIPFPQSPTKIINVVTPSFFSPKSDTFLENLMFPQMQAIFDLTGKIDDRSDRINVKRFLITNKNGENTQWFRDNIIANSDKSYTDMVNFLNQSGKSYIIDNQVIDLPLFTLPYNGEFKITNITTDTSGRLYTLDNINYYPVTDTSNAQVYTLKNSDKVNFSNAIFTISFIDTANKQIRISNYSGTSIPVINDYFHYFSNPFNSKIIYVPINFNECNIIFLKGINDDYNLLGNDWSNSISFYSSDLLLEGSNNIYLTDYYTSYVTDYSRILEGFARERFIPAYYGSKPIPPTISSTQFDVVQINTQLNATQNNDEILTTQQSIVTSKSNIDRYRNIVSDARARMQTETSATARAQLQKDIDTNISLLANELISYKSLINTLINFSKANPQILVEPKYRIRGFFEIPEGGPITNADGAPLQENIQFEIQHRYIRNDGTGNALTTHTHVDSSTGQTITGVFSDWNPFLTPIKIKVFNNTTGIYEWQNENIGNGEDVNINQIDIPIQKGEKVQIRIRTISEAGWPLNPIKSDWSTVITVEFPSNLAAQNQFYEILAGANAEETAIKLQETLSSAGVDTHLADSRPNPNATNGIYFKHQSSNLEFNQSEKDSNANIKTQQSTSLQEILDSFANKYYITVQKTSSSTRKTISLLTLLQGLIDKSGLDVTTLINPNDTNNT
jgi:hypothetical protein